MGETEVDRLTKGRPFKPLGLRRLPVSEPNSIKAEALEVLRKETRSYGFACSFEELIEKIFSLPGVVVLAKDQNLHSSPATTFSYEEDKGYRKGWVARGLAMKKDNFKKVELPN